MMISSWMRRAVAVASLTLCGGSAWALDGAASPGAGKAAAHAALRDRADVPSTPPRLPQSASDHAREALANPAVGKKAEAAGRVRAEAQLHISDEARAARADAANRAAEASVAAAAHNANADAAAAAGQARASAAKANGAAHRGTTGHP
jgi:hypothetical protein